MDTVNLKEKLALIHDQWHPRIVGELNDSYVKLAKIQGEFVWHSHANEDEMFLVLEGELTMRYRDHEAKAGPGEFIIVPRGVEHMPACEEEVSIMLLEPKTTVNTGDAGGERTVSSEWI